MTAPLSDTLAAAGDLRQLAQSLGRVCVDGIQEIGELRRQRGALELAHANLEDAAIAVDEDWWFDGRRRSSGFGDLLAFPAVNAPATLLETAPPLAYLAVLRAICRRPLHRFYKETWLRHDMCRGDPLPLPTRPTHTVFRPVTPSFRTQSLGSLLDGTPFRLYGGPINTPVEIELDFGDRDNLDAATWQGDDSAGRFPLVASIHPHATDADLAIDEVTETAFFGVRPRSWNEGAVLSQLEAAREAGIAMLPELSIPAPDALAGSLDANPERFPALVVAGSAHAELPATKGATLRVNQAEAYLHGAPLLTHRKVHAFRTSYLGPEYSRRDRIEDLSDCRRRITIAAGTHTRLAVVVCADLNEPEIPSLLEQAAVNLLLVPALTPSEGAFSGTCGQLASRCQALAIVVNGTAAVDPNDPLAAEPFMVMAAIPDPSPKRQVTGYTRPPGQRKAVGIFDTTKAPPAVRWL